MKKNYIAALAACIHLGATCARAQESNLNDDVVVVVTKRAKPGSMVGSAYSRIDEAEIQRSQSVSLTQALSTVPGVMAVDLGAKGSYSQFSIRGNTAAHTLYLLDGIRINTGLMQDAHTFLAYSGTSGIGSIEVARGPQSTLYGSDGIGGVIAVESERGKGKPTHIISSEVGSFSSFREGISSKGEIDQLAYSVSYEREDTANDRPHNDLSSNRYSLRLDYKINKDTSIRINFRGQVSKYQDPWTNLEGAYASNNPVATELTESNLISAMLDWKLAEQWTQKLTLGAYFERYVYDHPDWSGNNYNSWDNIYGTYRRLTNEAANYSGDWMHSLQITQNNLATAGVELNYQTAQDNTFYNHNTNWALYIQDEWEFFKNLNITSGLRYDNYKLAGDAWTYRFTGAYFLPKSDTKIRSSYGSAFQAPSLLRLYSGNPEELGNSNLKPETSRGWDAGFDQYLMSRALLFSATYFRNDVRNMIDYEYPSYVNREKGVNNGLELALRASLLKSWKTQISYTYTESTYTSSGANLRRKLIPRHQLGFDTNYYFLSKLTIGCGVTMIADREDRDPVSWAQRDFADYCSARIYSRYQSNDHISIFGRVENVTNANFENKIGYPSLPIGFYGGVELKF